MKKQMIIINMICVVVTMLALNQVQADGVPLEIELTLSGGATNVASATFADCVSRDVYSSMQLLAVEYDITGSITNAATLAIKRSADGPTYKSITVASNVTSGVSFETNVWHWFAGDTIYVPCSGITNAGTVTLICTEQ